MILVLVSSRASDHVMFTASEVLQFPVMKIFSSSDCQRLIALQLCGSLESEAKFTDWLQLEEPVVREGS